MKLIPAEGNQQQQRALKNSYACNVALILAEHIEEVPDLLQVVSEILQKYTGNKHEEVFTKLNSVRTLYEKEPSGEAPDYIIQLVNSLEHIYHSSAEQINCLRGAIVELLGRDLICPRYRSDGECANSRRFVNRYNEEVTIQEVDVAAISHVHFQLEGYECKMKSTYIMHDDCVDLAYLAKKSEEESYQAHVGIISLDPDKMVERRLNRLGTQKCIQGYGIESIKELKHSPFD
jgi:hypothetical protein